MTTKKWAIRVLLASAFFTGIICLSAPVQAVPMLEGTLEDYLKHESVCFVLAKVSGNKYAQERNLFRLEKYGEGHMIIIAQAAGFASGWMAAVLHATGVTKAEQAAVAHRTSCLEQA